MVNGAFASAWLLQRTGSRTDWNPAAATWSTMSGVTATPHAPSVGASSMLPRLTPATECRSRAPRTRRRPGRGAEGDRWVLVDGRARCARAGWRAGVAARRDRRECPCRDDRRAHGEGACGGTSGSRTGGHDAISAADAGAGKGRDTHIPLADDPFAHSRDPRCAHSCSPSCCSACRPRGDRPTDRRSRRSRRSARGAACDGRRAPTPVVASFDGLGVGFVGPQGNSHQRNPSDNSLAVGPDHIVQTINTRVAIFTKAARSTTPPGACSTVPCPPTPCSRTSAGRASRATAGTSWCVTTSSRSAGSS
jgi:hypothetical protein